jgi:glycosyltransferase involved in cell wall biosynthesis
MVPLEAQASGVPVLATRVGGHLDTVADESTGRLLPPGSAAALGAAAGGLLADPALRRRWGEAGHRRTRARFSWERVADGVENVAARVRRAHTVPAALGSR